MRPEARLETAGALGGSEAWYGGLRVMGTRYMASCQKP